MPNRAEHGFWSQSAGVRIQDKLCKFSLSCAIVSKPSGLALLVDVADVTHGSLVSFPKVTWTITLKENIQQYDICETETGFSMP